MGDQKKQPVVSSSQQKMSINQIWTEWRMLKRGHRADVTRTLDAMASWGSKRLTGKARAYRLAARILRVK